MQEQEFTLAGFIAGTLRLQLTPQRDIDPQTKVIAFFNPPSRVGRMIVWVEESSTAYCELHNVGILYGEPDNDESTFLERVGFAKIGWDEQIGRASCRERV